MMVSFRGGRRGSGLTTTPFEPGAGDPDLLEVESARRRLDADGVGVARRAEGADALTMTRRAALGGTGMAAV